MKQKSNRPPAGKNSKKSGQPKFRQERAEAKPSDKLRYEEKKPSGASGQHGPKSKEARKMDKSKLRVEKAGAKLDKAHDKLAKQNPQKPPGTLKTVSRTVGYEVLATFSTVRV
jgi:hypothetical protein